MSKRAASRADSERPAELASEAIVIGRGRQRRLDLTLARGNVADVNSRAVVVGLFRNVDPDGAAAAVDERIDGGIGEIVRSRMFAADAGAVFVLPTLRTRIKAEHVVLAGLGAIDRFAPEVVEVVARNLTKTLARANVDEFATVALGASSGQNADECVTHLLRGILSAVRDSDRRLFRGATLVEYRGDRFSQLRAAVYEACRQQFCDDFEIVVHETRLESPPDAAEHRGPIPAAKRSPVYLHVRTMSATASRLVLRLVALTAGSKAALIDAEAVIDRQTLRRRLAVIESDRFTPRHVDDLGRQLARLVLPKEVSRELAAAGAHHVTLIHDREASAIPWEVVRVEGWVPALSGGMSRRYVAEDVAVARWPERQSAERHLRVLLVIDPTEDLPAARKEGERLQKLGSRVEGLQIETLTGAAASHDAVLDAIGSERFDVLHYAGHAFFSDKAPGESGLECSDRPLRAHELLRLRSLPALMFFNACESARVRQASRTPGANRIGVRADRASSTGFAETLMRAGVANIVGTYWPVGDQAAGTFADVFYTRLLGGSSIGSAMLDGRRAVKAISSVDWADYIHYGNPDFALKFGESQPSKGRPARPAPKT
jgi:hypothetical protein